MNTNYIVNLQFSMLGPRLTEQQASAFATMAQWVVLGEREGRLFVDGIGNKIDIDRVLAMLVIAGRDPKIIGAWYIDGAPVAAYPFSLENFLEVAPDEFDYTDPENPVPVRPARYVEIHSWAGWAPKQILS